MKTTTRKTMLYPTKVEYGDYAMNHVEGCAHGCAYPCYAYAMAKRWGHIKNQKQWCEPKLVSNTLELLDSELKVNRRVPIKNVHLCFATDPFMMGYPEVSALSLKAIKKLNEHGIPCTVLTKGVLPHELSELSLKNTYGITLVSLSRRFHDIYEPYASLPQPRIDALKQLHDQGCTTWVSMEPYPTPNVTAQNMLTLLDKIKFVDRIVFGKFNYSLLPAQFGNAEAFYSNCVSKLCQYCRENNIEYHIKKGTEL